MLLLPGTDPGLERALAAALDGGRPVAPLPPDPSAALAMLQPDEPVVEDDAALIVATSGSTGTPKGVVLSRRAVVSGSRATHDRLGGPGNWTLAVPPHYVAGVMVIARTLVAGTRLQHASSDLSDLPEVTGRNYISLVPTQLVRGLADPRITKRLVAYDAILLGGAAAAPELLARAEERGVHVVTSYGSSETSGGCIYDGVPLDGVTVDLVPAPDRPGTTRVAITGDVVFSGYRLRPDLTHEVLDGRTLLTRDRADWVDRRLRILGRLDDVVISGGINVDLAAVERALHEVDPHGVALGVPDPEWGTRIIVAITTDQSLTDVRAALTTLESPARPRGLLRRDPLPLTQTGKIDRQQLLEWWAAGPAERPAWKESM